MCGICGKIYFDAARQVEPEILKEMARLLNHRGPDEDGFHVKGNVGLGHRRLSIIDLAGGQQPIYNEDRTLVILFNGEIYNHRLLREELVSKGHRFSTHSDTEVIVHLY
jgi:asparagine synthase (glutamine-hydrolysing)